MEVSGTMAVGNTEHGQVAPFLLQPPPQFIQPATIGLEIQPERGDLVVGLLQET